MTAEKKESFSAFAASCRAARSDEEATAPVVAALKGSGEWREALEAVVVFTTTHGNEPGPTDGRHWTWLSNQRRGYEQGRLTAFQEAELERCRLVDGSSLATWKADLRLALDDAQAQGRWATGSRLATAIWCDRQRAEFAAGSLPPRAESALMNVEFDFENHDSDWHSRLQALSASVAAGPRAQTNDRVDEWVVDQRADFAAGNLGLGRIHALSEVGFEWVNADWWSAADELEVFIFRHQRLPAGKAEGIGRWLADQSDHALRHELSQSQLGHLRDMGVDVEPETESWQARRWQRSFDSLPIVADRRDTWIAPAEPSLRRWLADQRTASRRGDLSLSRESQLRLVGGLRGVREQKRADELAIALDQAGGESGAPAVTAWLEERRRDFVQQSLDPDVVVALVRAGTRMAGQQTVYAT